VTVVEIPAGLQLSPSPRNSTATMRLPLCMAEVCVRAMDGNTARVVDLARVGAPL